MAMSNDETVFGSLGFGMHRGLGEFDPELLAQNRADFRREFRVGIDAGADGRTADFHILSHAVVGKSRAATDRGVPAERSRRTPGRRESASHPSGACGQS